MRLDSAMRIAIEIGRQAGLNMEVVKAWYGEAVLGEMRIGEFFERIGRSITDPALLSTFTELKRSLPMMNS